MMDQILFLSDDWVEASNTALGGLPPERSAPWSVCYVVNNGPSGTTMHRLLFDGEGVSARRGADGASVTLTLDWELAVAVNQGTGSAQSAFLDGRIQLSGDVGVLMGNQHQLTTADQELIQLRERTIYGLAPAP